jgi:hypothetical protein
MSDIPLPHSTVGGIPSTPLATTTTSPAFGLTAAAFQSSFAQDLSGLTARNGASDFISLPGLELVARPFASAEVTSLELRLTQIPGCTYTVLAGVIYEDVVTQFDKATDESIEEMLRNSSTVSVCEFIAQQTNIGTITVPLSFPPSGGRNVYQNIIPALPCKLVVCVRSRTKFASGIVLRAQLLGTLSCAGYRTPHLALAMAAAPSAAP